MEKGVGILNRNLLQGNVERSIFFPDPDFFF
jgi:hypothetical protein